MGRKTPLAGFGEIVLLEAPSNYQVHSFEILSSGCCEIKVIYIIFLVFVGATFHG